MNRVMQLAQKPMPPYLLFDSAVHALEHPDNQASFDDFADEPECPRLGRTHTLLLRRYGEEVLEEPFRDEEQAKVVLLCDFWALRFDILE
jgi:hypothetical protein